MQTWVESQCIFKKHCGRLSGTMQADLLQEIYGHEANLFVTSQLTRYQICMALSHALGYDRGGPLKVPTHHVPSLKQAGVCE